MRVLRLQNKKYVCFMPYTKDLKAQKYMSKMTRLANPQLHRAVMTERVVASNAVSIGLIKFGEVALRPEGLMK